MAFQQVPFTIIPIGISIERKFFKESNFLSRKNFVHSFTRKQGLGKVSLYRLETPTQKFRFTSPLGIKTLYPRVDMGLPVCISIVELEVVPIWVC